MIDRLYREFLPNQMDSRVLADLVERETRIETTFNTFRGKLDGQPVTDNEIRDILGSDADISRRQKAWEASKQVGASVADELGELVEVRNREARNLGFDDYYMMKLELQELDEKWLFTLLDNLEEASEEAFGQVKGGLDRDLRRRFAVDGEESYPWLYGDAFFQELPAVDISDRLDAIFKDRDLVGLTRDHFGSMGLEIDDLLARADLYERDGKSQHAFCLDVDRSGDVRVLCNVRSDERWMGTMLHEFGHAVYDKYSDPSLPFSLREPAHILTTEAIAMLNGRMTKMPAWLETIAGLGASEAEALADDAFGAMRASMLIFLRWGLTLVRFERELYRDPGQRLNALWWELVGSIQRITPPPDRDCPDWASKIHLAVAPVYYQNYILGELMASQLLGYIEAEVAESANVNCPAVGDYLVEKIFRPGARWEWNTMLEKATGERLNAAHFLRQFQLS